MLRRVPPIERDRKKDAINPPRRIKSVPPRGTDTIKRVPPKSGEESYE